MTSEWIPPPGREAGFYDIRLNASPFNISTTNKKNHTFPNRLVKRKVLLKIYMHHFFSCILFLPFYVWKKKDIFLDLKWNLFLFCKDDIIFVWEVVNEPLHVYVWTHWKYVLQWNLDWTASPFMRSVCRTSGLSKQILLYFQVFLVIQDDILDNKG